MKERRIPLLLAGTLCFMQGAVAQTDPQGLKEEVAALRAQVTQLTAVVSTLRARLDTLGVGTRITFDSTHNAIVITGADLQIVNGMGRTATTNGTGNLIVGYNEVDPNALAVCSDIHTGPTNWRQGFQGLCTARAWGANQHLGSHNLVIGSGNSYTQYGGMVVGANNAITNGFSSVIGGLQNAASAFGATVSGGLQNTANGSASSVSGGFKNIASGHDASISGGESNTASGQGSSVSGGLENTASGRGHTSVSGGFRNVASGAIGTVGGGASNTARAAYSTVSGGAAVVESQTSGWAGGGYHTP